MEQDATAKVANLSSFSPAGLCHIDSGHNDELLVIAPSQKWIPSQGNKMSLPLLTSQDSEIVCLDNTYAQQGRNRCLVSLVYVVVKPLPVIMVQPFLEVTLPGDLSKGF